ncbi:RDD family protein [Aquabacterium sp.]|uniref:RDD family protein n=1 Tax=Aquabacterium sp. TaxID=1872578 RepID=UPI0035ADEDCE
MFLKKSAAPTYEAATPDMCVARAQAPAPSLRRRMAAFLYEGVLLFGLVMAVALVFGIAVGQRHAMTHREGLQAWLFLSFALYFIWFWTHGGQTLAMKTWHLRMVSQDGGTISMPRALARFLASWVWFIPSLAGSWLAGWHQSKLLYGAMVGWVVIYALSALLNPKHLFWHDMLCGTRLIDNRANPTP